MSQKDAKETNTEDISRNSEVKTKKSISKFLFSAVGVISFVILSLQLITYPPVSGNYDFKQIIGIISLVFWSALLLWATYKFIRR